MQLRPLITWDFLQYLKIVKVIYLTENCVEGLGSGVMTYPVLQGRESSTTSYHCGNHRQPSHLLGIENRSLDPDECGALIFHCWKISSLTKRAET